jgi:thioredoxin reductase
MVREKKIPYQLDTMVMDIGMTDAPSDGYKYVSAYSSVHGIQTLKTKAVILAMGCREKPRGALNIPGYRPAGIYSAGTAQKFVNIDGVMPGKEVVILGSGDIGLIMARRMTLQGAKVKMVVEIMPYSGGLKRNIVQCLDDFKIPLLLSHTVTEIKGRDRVEAVVISEVDENLKPIPGTGQEVKCDTLLLSVGLIPENELSRKMGIEMSRATRGAVVTDDLETSCPGVFACGNVLHVHDLVDYVSDEAGNAGRNAALFVQNKGYENAEVPKHIKMNTGKGVRYTVPGFVRPDTVEKDVLVRFRVDNNYKDIQFGIAFDGTVERTIKKRTVAPGEMEEIRIKKEELDKYPDVTEITIGMV